MKHMQLCVVLLFHIFLSSALENSLDPLEVEAPEARLSIYPKAVNITKRAAKAFRSVDNVEVIPANYNIFETPPTPDGSPTRVTFSIILMSVRDINEKDEEMTASINLRMFWKDTRLSRLANSVGNDSKFLVLAPNLLHKIWHPDVFIDHSISVSQPTLISPPASLRIYADSVVRYSARLWVKMACQMDFHFYPVDTQRCRVNLKSYAYTDHILELAWQKDRGAYIANKLDLPNFDVNLEETKNYTTQTSSGFYSNLELTISLRRRLSYHLIQTYLPSSIFLIVSWLSFLIPKESVPERIGSCMMTLLTLTVMFGSVGQSMPKVSYLTALDVWMVTCIVFVFAALIEFTVVLKLWSLEREQQSSWERKEKLNNLQMKQLSKNRGGSFQEEIVTESLTAKATREKIEKLDRVARTLELVSSKALPCLFLLFNCIYWPWLNYFADGYVE